MTADWQETLAGVAVVTVTPFAGPELGAIDAAALESNLAFLLRRGVRLLVAAGHAGEFATLTPPEALQTARIHVAIAGDRARVLAGVGHRVDEAVELGRRAMGAGADGLLVHEPPVPYATDRGLAEYYLRLGRGLPDAPLVLYLRHRILGAASLERITREVPNIVGVIVGVPEVAYLTELFAAAPDLGWVCGAAEEHAIDFWPAGAHGFTSGIANFLPTHSLAAFAEMRLGRLSEAKAITGRLLPLETMRARQEAGNDVAAIKAAMDMLGLIGGGVRPPLSGLLPRERVELARVLRGLQE